MFASLYHKAYDTKAHESNVDNVNYGIAFAGLVSYIEDVRMGNLVASVFELTDLVNVYSTRLVQLGMHAIGRVHSTRVTSQTSLRGGKALSSSTRVACLQLL